jgi:hypothetical protein
MINYLYLDTADYSRVMGIALESYLVTKMESGHIEDLAINSAEFFESSYHCVSALSQELLKKIMPISKTIIEIKEMHDLSDLGSERKDVLEQVLKVIERNLNGDA